MAYCEEFLDLPITTFYWLRFFLDKTLACCQQGYFDYVILHFKADI